MNQVHKNVCIIDGHPDPSGDRFGHALANFAEEGAREAGHTVSRITLGELEIPLLTRPEDFDTPPPDRLLLERQKMADADHIMFMFPLWMGDMPAKTKAFIEQVARDRFFLDTGDESSQWPKKLMKGKSMRIIVTMGMPALAYKFVMDDAVLKATERGMFGLSGFKPVRHTILGGVGSVEPGKYTQWLEDVKDLGASCK